MGHWAKGGVRKGSFRQVGKREMLDIKREAEAHGMVNWIMNVDGNQGPVLLLLLRMLLPRHAADQGVQRAGHDCPAAFPAAAWTPAKCVALRPLRARRVRWRAL